MTKDPIVGNHIAESKAKIAKATPETVETERHIDRAQRALERSRKLLEDVAEALPPPKRAGDLAAEAAKDRPGAPSTKRSFRKAKRRR